MATRERLELALRNAHAAGDTAAAKAFADAIRNGQYDDAPKVEAVSVEVSEPAAENVKSQESGGMNPIAAGALEFMSGVNRGAARAADFVTTAPINAAFEIAGSEKRIPTIESLVSPATQGGFMQTGIAQQAVSQAGEVIPSALLAGQGLRSAASHLSGLAPGAESVGAGALRQMAGTTAGQDVLYGALGGAGAALGGSAGQVIGGDSGRAIGSILGGIAAPLSVAGGAAAINRGTAQQVDRGARIAAGSTENELAALQAGGSLSIPQRIAAAISPGAPEEVRAAAQGIAPIARSNKLAEDALSQGFDEGVISSLNQANKSTREKALKMAQISAMGKKNSRFSMDNRPTDVIGDSLLERISYVKNVNRDAGKRLEQAASELKGQRVDYLPPVQSFLDRIQGMGIQVVREGGKFKPAFEGSDIEGMSDAQKPIENLIARLNTGAAPDAYDVHRLKMYIDNQVDYGKSAGGMVSRVEGAIKAFRHDLDSTLDNNFPSYNEVNTQYAETIGALDNIQKAVGPSIKIFGENADKALGTKMRALMSNQQNRINLENSLGEIDSVAAKYGASFDDDLKALAMFGNELDRMFGAHAKTSLAGEIEKNTDRGVRSAAELAQGNYGNAAIGAVSSTINKIRGVNDENAYKSIFEYLRD